MKFTVTILPFAALSSAFVIPDEQLAHQMRVETHQESRSLLSKLSGKTSHLFDQVQDAVSIVSQNALDVALSTAGSVEQKLVDLQTMSAFDGQSWLDSSADFLSNAGSALMGHHGHHGRHGKHGHEHKPNKTVYELINESKYTTKLASFINEYDDLVEALNGTAANFTVFAPTDAAFEKALKHHPKPDRDTLKACLAYHVSADYYPARRILSTHTIPSTYGGPGIAGRRQRLRVGLGWKGLVVNFYSKIIAVDIFGTNGVIHGVDSVLMRPLSTAKILTLLPGEFSTLVLALEKADMWDEVAAKHTKGGTFFVPSNWAFQKLGARANMFLFSEKGKKYLRALISYHAVGGHTLYSDAYYPPKSEDDDDDEKDEMATMGGFKDIPRGKFQIELPTCLKGKTLNVDIARFGGFISMRLNGFNDVTTQDGVAEDGVLHKLDSILLPPKVPGMASEEIEGEISVEELIARLGPIKEEL